MAIPNQTVTTYHVGEVKQEFKAGIRAEDFPHIANLLINLYSNPIEAVMREYATNALDSHIDAGLDRPIEITLPTSESLELIIQDHGIGLSIDDLENVYSMYGRSTKRESNKATGQLGLGCKSGLTYADAFTITAVKDGVKCVAMSTKDEHGVGTIQVIDTLGTAEPNGVRIAIPIKYRDVQRFHDAAERLFQFWEPGTVLINGKAPSVPEWRKQALAIDDDTFVVPSCCDLWRSYVICGNVAYEVEDAVIPNPRGRDFQLRFVARLNMTDVDIVPSREAVNNTPHTIETLSDLRKYITANFDRVLAKRLAEAESRWDETQLKVLWRGSQIGLNASADTPIWDYNPNGRMRQARANTSYRYSHLTDTRTVVVTKFPNKTLATTHRSRLKEFAPDCRQFLIVPNATESSGLAGRENTVTWDEVLADTEPVADPVTGKRVKRDETKYNVLGGTPMTAGELAKLTGTVLMVGPKAGTPYGTFGATIVQMFSSNQEGRLRRLVPGIKSYWEESRERKAAAVAALTDADRTIYSASHLDRAYRRLPADSVEDSRLAEAIRLANAPMPDTVVAARKFDIDCNLGTWAVDLEGYLRDRYPLANPRRFYYGDDSTEDVALYINAKNAAIEAQEDTLDAAAS